MTSRYTTHRTSHTGTDLRNLPQPKPPAVMTDDDEFSDFKSGLPTSSGTGVSLTPLPLLSKNLLQFNFSPVRQSNSQTQTKETRPVNPTQQGEVGNRLANYNVCLKNEGRVGESCLIGDEDKYSPLRTFLQNESKQTQESYDEVTGGSEPDFGDFQSFTKWDSPEEHLSVVVPVEEVPHVTPLFVSMSPQVLVPTIKNPVPIESQHSTLNSVDDFGDFVSFSKFNHSSPPLPLPLPAVTVGIDATEKTRDLSDLFGLGISSTRKSSNFNTTCSDLVDLVPMSTDRRVSGDRRLSIGAPLRHFPFDGVPPLKTTLITGPTGNDTDDPFGDFLVGNSRVDVSGGREGSLNTKIPKNENSPETLSVSSLDLGNYGSSWEVPDFMGGNKGHLTLTPKETPKGSPLAQKKDKYNPFKQEQQLEIQKCVKEWRRVLQTCLRLLEEGERIFHSVSSSEVIREVIQTDKGRDYVLSLRQIYLVACRVYQSWMRLDGTEMLGELHQKLALAWDSVAPFLVGTNLEEDVQRRSPNSEDKDENVCGICLVGTGWREGGGEEESWRLSLDFGGAVYHLPCANFWINQVDALLPSLTGVRNSIHQLQNLI